MKLFGSKVTPVVDYEAAIWAGKMYACCMNVQHRAMRTFLGTGKKSPLLATDRDMDRSPVRVHHQKEIVRYYVNFQMEGLENWYLPS